jgi:hypothetical protein
MNNVCHTLLKIGSLYEKAANMQFVLLIAVLASATYSKKHAL